MTGKFLGSSRHPRGFLRITPAEVCFAIVALVLLAFCVQVQRSVYDEDWWPGSGAYEQKVRIPNKEVIKLASLGYESMYADFLGLRAVQMYGAGWRTPNNETEPIYEYFDVVTHLAPHNIDLYQFANLILSDDRADHGLGLQILRKGLIKNPNSWELAFLGMYTALEGMEDTDTAKEFLRYAKRIPDTPEHVLRMEEYIERQSGRFFSAFDVNLGYYLRYLENGMETDASVVYNRFTHILERWNFFELARAADKYYQDHGDYPRKTIDILDEKYRPEFRAPFMPKLDELVRYYQAEGGKLIDYQDEIREGSMIDISGLPPQPHGTWYYLDSQGLQAFIQNPPAFAENESLDRKHPYFSSAFERVMLINRRLLVGQQTIMEYVQANDRPPGAEELYDILGADGLGGHIIYRPQMTHEDGTVGPGLMSTALLRIDSGREPRMGLTGGPENFPPREVTVVEDQPPYLAPEPTIWDFPEDIEWGMEWGLIPGVPFLEQPEVLQERARGKFGPPEPEIEIPEGT